ncbi:MAG: NAD(+)--dinitrogen-reductase ADP-D-ribosyltransferase [Magnetococcales bacterium]|nr:NAD(+)--dinitrogen-reductase ADP-D-ribosyltransferase [Magnetococcales bacterium]NGZ25908.1 NAD(+)--dinitrogen-reductase ADP-D-ribosyltransferase [Magnetococcales bacterium]
MSGCQQAPDGEYWRPPRECWTRFNRCNLPSSVLACLDYQSHPEPVELDGVAFIHKDLFVRLRRLSCPEERAIQFMDYMAVYFSLASPESAGFSNTARIRRNKADYLGLLRGWLFDPDGREGAVLKGWVASRFGLLPRYFGGRLAPDSESYQRFLQMQSAGVYNTNNLEGQLDLLYTYCQYELNRQMPEESHLSLFRGINRLAEHDLVARLDKRRCVVLLNNLNSFTTNRERADEFGDQILETRAPISKIFFYSALLPGVLKGEEEYLVIGGLYEVKLW